MRKLKILYDYTPACKKTKVGIPYFTYELYKALSKRDDIKIDKTICLSKFLPTKPWKFFRFIEKIIYHDIYIPLKLKFGNYDIYIENQYMYIPLLKFKNKNALIVTIIHDIGLILFDNIQLYKTTKSWRKKIVKSILNSDIIITVSRSSMLDIQKYLASININDKVLDYIYEDSSIKVFKDKVDVLNKFKINSDYFLFLGTIEPRKNILNLVKAFKIFRDRYNGTIKLVLAGKKGWLYEDVISYIDKNNLKNEIIFTGYITEKDKYYLLKNAKAFIFLSIYEGFGIPPLEALKLNIPTLLSDIPVFRELYKNNVLYANPKDIKNIAFMLQKVLVSPAKINQKELKIYSWDNSAKKLIEILKKEINI